MHHWHNTTKTFRIITERRTIVGNDVKVGDHESRIHMLVFDFERMYMNSSSATNRLLTEFPLQTQGQWARRSITHMLNKLRVTMLNSSDTF